MKHGSGRSVRGSDLLEARTLRRIVQLHAATGTSRMVLLFLVDGDEVTQRERDLRTVLDSCRHDHVVLAVARPEFEAWLVADHQAAGNVVGRPLQQSKDPESMRRGEPKALLATWLEGLPDPSELRRKIASDLDLDRVTARCAALASLRAELRARLPS